MADFVDSFYEPKETGDDGEEKSGAERLGDRLSIDKRTELDVVGTFEGLEMDVFSNTDEARHGESYGLIGVKPEEVGPDDGHDPIIGEVYKAFFNFDTKTRKQSAQDKEYESFVLLVSDITGENFQRLIRSGKDFISEFINSGGAEWIGEKYRFYNEGQGGGWYRLRAEPVD